MIRWILAALILLPAVAYYTSSLLTFPAGEAMLPQPQVTAELADDGPYAYYMALGMSLADVNEQYRQSLGIPRQQLREVPVLNFLYGSLGPGPDD